MSAYAVILCGGSGTRLWPLSRTMQPKQLLALNGTQTLLQQTAKRLLEHVTADRLFTVTHEDHKFQVKGQLADLALDAVSNVLAEPMARNTLPAIAWAAYQIYQREPGAIIGVFASDHAIDNEPAFLQAWQAAEQVAQQGYLVLLGIKPHEPATGYGYIKPGLNRILSGLMPAYEVERFVEKPDLPRAQEFLQQGFLWNSGMFVFKANVFMEMLATYQPEIDKLVRALKAETLAEQYADFPNLSMDYGLAEKAEKVAVVPVDMAWSDFGQLGFALCQTA